MCMLNGQPVTAINPKAEDNPFPDLWSTYLASDDLDATAAKDKEAGSQFLMEPMDVMGSGRLAFAMDPTGAPYGIWQAGEHTGVGVYNGPGALFWNESMTRDYEGAKNFYNTVFGFTYDEVGQGSSYSMIKRAGDGQVVAGLGKLDASTPAQVHPSWVTYFMVQDCDASAAKAAELGATIVGQPSETPAGRLACLIGAQGEAFSLIQTQSEQ